MSSDNLVAKVVNVVEPSLFIDDGHGRQLLVSLTDGVDAYVEREVVKYLKAYASPTVVYDDDDYATLASINALKKWLTS